MLRIKVPKNALNSSFRLAETCCVGVITTTDRSVELLTGDHGFND